MTGVTRWGQPQYIDRNGDGDLYNDAYLSDTRLQPLPHAGATVHLDRYAVVIPPGTAGPVAVTAAVYYQSFEAMVAKKLLGNLADTNQNFTLEPCVLRGPCDGRHPTVEPPVVEGAPPVPMAVTHWVIALAGTPDTTPPTVTTYPAAGATHVYEDVVVTTPPQSPGTLKNTASAPRPHPHEQAFVTSRDAIGADRTIRAPRSRRADSPRRSAAASSG